MIIMIYMFLLTWCCLVPMSCLSFHLGQPPLFLTRPGGARGGLYYNYHQLGMEKKGKINGDASASMAPFYSAQENTNASSSSSSPIQAKAIDTELGTIVKLTDTRNKDANKTLLVVSSNTAWSNITTAKLDATTLNESVPGIGGLGGVVYDVNKLKRNLLQETMRLYKRELLQLIDSPTTSEAIIVDKLASLVQGSPVRTTTDSNLLDGIWCLAYQSKYSTVGDLRDYRRAYPRMDRWSSVTASMNQRRGGKEPLFKTVLRTYHLEELEADEDPYITEELRWMGGLLKVVQHYSLTGLTRRSMTIRPSTARQWSVAGQTILRKSVQEALTGSLQQPPQDIQVIHLDVDMCVLAEAPLTARKPPEQCLFSVYTKNDDWVQPPKRLKRKLRWLLLTLRRVMPFLPKRLHTNNTPRLFDTTEGDSILQILDFSDDSKLRVLRLGDLRDAAYDQAWDGRADPFVHLTPDERQQALKAMNIGQIAKAGKTKLTKSRRQQWLERFFRKRRTFFRRPGSL